MKVIYDFYRTGYRYINEADRCLEGALLGLPVGFTNDQLLEQLDRWRLNEYLMGAAAKGGQA